MEIVLPYSDLTSKIYDQENGMECPTLDEVVTVLTTALDSYSTISDYVSEFREEYRIMSLDETDEESTGMLSILNLIEPIEENWLLDNGVRFTDAYAVVGNIVFRGTDA